MIPSAPIGNWNCIFHIYKWNFTAVESSGTMLSIVAAQRERLRSRNEELELLNDQQQNQISLLQVAVFPSFCVWLTVFLCLTDCLSLND